MREISAVFAQWVNSYKRLVPGYEAPVCGLVAPQSLGSDQDPALQARERAGDEGLIRCPDPACNPYLTFAALLHAGLEGIEQVRAAAADGEQSLQAVRGGAEARGIVALPETLGEAIDELQSRISSAGRWEITSSTTT